MSTILKEDFPGLYHHPRKEEKRIKGGHPASFQTTGRHTLRQILNVRRLAASPRVGIKLKAGAGSPVPGRGVIKFLKSPGACEWSTPPK